MGLEAMSRTLHNPGTPMNFDISQIAFDLLTWWKTSLGEPLVEELLPLSWVELLGLWGLELVVLGGLLTSDWVLTDLLVSSLVDALDLVSGDALGDVPAELLLVGSLVLLELLHVVSDVTTEDVVLFSLDLVLLVSALGEPLVRVWDKETAIDGTLKDGENTSTSGGPPETDIEEGLEWPPGFLIIFLFDWAGELLLKAELLKEPAGAKETDAVGGGVVGKTKLDAIGNEVLRGGGSDGDIVVNLGGDDLGDDLGVGDTGDKAVLLGTVLGLVLLDEGSPLDEVGLALTPPAEWGLEAAEVAGVLNDLSAH